jgi:hypothetical protein
MFGNVRETDNYYAEYIDFLEQKVVQQRQKALREKEEAERLRILKLEEEVKLSYLTLFRMFLNGF